MRNVLASAILFLGASLPAAAEDKALKDFFGEWVGSGTAKDAAATQDRASTVMIDRLADGFKITWSTMRSQADTPATSVVKSTTIKFKGTQTPGKFDAVDNADPLKGGRSAWATLSGATLKIQMFNVEPDGTWTVQVYDRTLTAPDAMNASYRRIVNGEVARKAELKLKKSP